MKHIWTIAAKEWSRFFAEKGMAIVTVLLPGILLWAMYSAMGHMDFGDSDKDTVVAAVENPPGALFRAAAIDGLSTVAAPDGLDGPEAIRDALESDDYDLFVRFPEDFDTAVVAYDSASGNQAPTVEIFYDSSDSASAAGYEALRAGLDAYESTLSNRFDVNPGASDAYDLASEEDFAARMLSMLFPMLIVFMIFSSIVAVAAESFAGEKERGTIAAILATPVPRRNIAIGKVLAVAGISLLAALFTVVGLVLGLSSYMTALTDDLVSAKVYGPSDYFMIALLVISVTAILVVVAIALSGLAKTTKDAQVLAVPAYAVVMIAGVASMIVNEPRTGSAWYLIPVFNAIEAMKGVFALEASPLNIAIACAVNLGLAAAGVFLLARMLDSERLMFQR